MASTTSTILMSVINDCNDFNDSYDLRDTTPPLSPISVYFVIFSSLLVSSESCYAFLKQVFLYSLCLPVTFHGLSTTIQVTGNITHVGVERVHRMFREAKRMQHSWASICLGLTCRYAHGVSMMLALISDEQGDLGGNGSSQKPDRFSVMV
jgi:hypothetical protein